MRLATALLATFSAVALPAFATAQTRGPTQFTIVGHIESFKLDPACASASLAGDGLLCGATIRVHGIDIVVPRNLIVQMPALTLTPRQIFEMNPNGPAESGLALDDATKPLAAFEASVVGNIAEPAAGQPRQHIAGLLTISQLSLAAGAGYISEIRADGTLLIVPDGDGPAAATPTRLRVNDPTHAFAPADPNPKADRRFAVDSENPTVRALTGYPMCVPGADACSVDNRPPGPPQRNAFVAGITDLGAPVPGALPIDHCSTCDPTRKARFAVGDFVTYAGTLAQDADGSTYISAHTLVDNLAIYTDPGREPSYAVVEASLIGTQGPFMGRDAADPYIRTLRIAAADTTTPTVPQETQDRLRVEGFTTDPSRDVDIYAVDVDPAGVETLRLLQEAPTPAAPPFGRFRVQLGQRANALFDVSNVLKGAPREIMARVAAGSGGAPAGTPYRSPIAEFIFPENTSPGDPPLPNNFECLSFLINGSGPLGKTDASLPAHPVVGRLSPWPGGEIVAGLNDNLVCGPRPKPIP